MLGGEGGGGEEIEDKIVRTKVRVGQRSRKRGDVCS